ncbi:lectin family integral membrane protein [Aspergillus steynii IBT 23096]|uniref:Lectin family integral membrane protein n=1 Tax=Aspergillus steynii IBT 23096 TaxID=1392250 RepID=A0A2I2GEH3_9EURO|nr:lectin family integral membrane protein [Aspergillus steynii IBT 23096]PLB51241.1 lectin family integral membrane protein [Aspergillus steynii IBT 23096]
MKFHASFPFFAAVATAQSLIESSSFGWGQTISPSRDSIPGWQVGGEGHTPQILSNKMILTPPYPGNTRGFAWAQTPVSQQEWEAEFQFRASGIERGGGNLQLWYAKDGQSKIGTSSIYTVGQFDGLALVIDTHGGRGGSVRGFLNDGTTDYKSHKSVDSLAFGHCDYPYRNLGRPSVLRVKHTSSVLQVTVDDKLCFTTNKVALPAGNNFGLTSATPENPDSFEVFKFVLQTSAGGSAPPPVQQQSNQKPVGVGKPQQAPPRAQIPPTTPQSTIDQQFADLRSSLQLINHATGNIIREIGSQSNRADNRQTELFQRVAGKDEVAHLDTRLKRIEQTLEKIQKDLEGRDYRDRFNQLQDTLRSSHLTLTESLQGHVFNVITASTPRMGFFIFLIIAFQVVLAVSYVIYKRRRANMPKKFL